MVEEGENRPRPDIVEIEVDHPATQQYKQKRIGGRTARADIRYVAVDFEKEQFSQGLERAGFRSADPSVWIWEGVAMYLPLGAIHDTLQQLTALAAAGSELAMTYRVPGVFPFGMSAAFLPLSSSAGGSQ